MIRRARALRRTLRIVVGVLALTASLLVAMKAASEAVAAGAPGWMNLVVLFLAWEAIEVVALSVRVPTRCLSNRLCRAVPSRAWRR